MPLDTYFEDSKISGRTLQDYTELRKVFWGQLLWAQGYFAASVGTVTDEVVKEYIENRILKQEMMILRFLNDFRSL
jgi:putative transposase